jgi:hypothetical protein
MKKISICALALLTAFTMQAQNKKGNLLVGTYFGGTGANFGNTESSNTTSPTISKSKNNSFNLGIGPNVGIYLSDNFVLGTYLGINFYSSKTDNSNSTTTATAESKYHSVTFNISPYGRLYFGDNKGKGMPYVQINTGLTFYPSDQGTYTPSTGTGYTYKTKKYLGVNAGFNIGYEHFINNIIGLQYYVGYGYTHYKYDYFYDFTSGTDYTYTYTSNSSNINFGVGLNIHLTCKKKDKK